MGNDKHIRGRRGHFEGQNDDVARDPYLQRDQCPEVRAWLEGELDRPFNEKAWDLVLDVLVLLQIARQKPDVGRPQILRQYEIFEERVKPGSRKHRSSERIGPSDDRLWALAEIAVLWAARELGVVAFRQQALKDRLIDPQEVPRWVADHRAAEGEPAEAYVRFPLRNWERIEAVLDIQSRNGLVQWLRNEAAALQTAEAAELVECVTYGPETLSFFAPGRPEEVATIRRDGQLAQLKQVVTGLVERYGWPEHYAVCFVLSGWQPPFSKWRWKRTYGAMPALNRISLEVDPRMSSGQVAKVYNDARGQKRATRDVGLSPKFLRLALFTATRAGRESTWSGLQVEWNATSAEDQDYPDRDDRGRRFALDCRKAWERLTGLSWDRFPQAVSTEGGTHDDQD